MAQSGYQFELSQQMINAVESNDVKSLDRIMDQNQAGENSLIPKRPQYNENQNSSKNAQRRLKSPKNSNVTTANQKQPQTSKKVTLKHLQINNPSEITTAPVNFKHHANGTGNF